MQSGHKQCEWPCQLVQCVCLRFCVQDAHSSWVFSFLSTLQCHNHTPKGCQQVSVFNRQAPAFSPVLGMHPFSSKCRFTSPNLSAKHSSLQGLHEAAASFKWWQGCTEVGVSYARPQLTASSPYVVLQPSALPAIQPVRCCINIPIPIKDGRLVSHQAAFYTHDRSIKRVLIGAFQRPHACSFHHRAFALASRNSWFSQGSMLSQSGGQ